MKITNLTKNKVIVEDAKEPKSFLARTVGLIGAKAPYPLILNTRFGIHTFGVRFPMDVVIVDKENKVAATRENLLANRVFFWNPLFEKVIELPQGTIEKAQISVGDEVSFT
ncbi:MAG: DUF192 domain-containing protein [Candidatus Woykebacteria bacterium]